MNLSPERERPPQTRSGRPAQFCKHGSELLCSYDLHGNVIEINDALARYLGYTRQEARGTHLSAFLDALSAERAHLDVANHLKGGPTSPLQIAARGKRGVRVTLELSTRLIFEKGAPVAVMAFGQVSESGAGETTQAED